MRNRIIGIDVSKAVSITAVIIIHSISATIAPFLKTWPQIGLILGADQVMRFCVPFFIAVSGYLLAGKYVNTRIKFVPFLKKRALKLLPAYLFWSGIIYIYLNYFTNEPKNPYNVLQIIFLGRADYHLYFVPLLFYLYLLFPLIILSYRKSKLITLIVALALQLGVIYFTTLVTNQTIKLPFLWNDQQQYVFPLSWIFYFVLGVHLSQMKIDRTTKTIKVISAVLLVPAVVFLIANSLIIYTKTLNYIGSTTFTRIPILAYASLAIAAFLLWQKTQPPVPQKINSPVLKPRVFSFSLDSAITPGLKARVFQLKITSIIQKIGRRSYSIYLFHTIVIRILYGIFQPKDLPMLSAFTIAVILITFTASFILRYVQHLMTLALPLSSKR